MNSYKPSSFRQHANIGSLLSNKDLRMPASKKSSGFLSSATLALLGTLALYSVYKFFSDSGDAEEEVGKVPEEPPAEKVGEVKLPEPVDLSKRSKEAKDSTPDAKPEPSLFESFSKKIGSLFETDKEDKATTKTDKGQLSTGKVTGGPSDYVIKDATTISGKPLKEGYRAKFTFSGLKEGDALAKGGSYTQEEASRIVTLKSKGMNTRASGGISQDIKDSIIAKSSRAGLDPTEMLKVVTLESGGNPNAISSTGAIGLFQFTGATASSLGITDRFDINQNIDGGIALALSNMKVAEKMGLDSSSSVTIYLMHQLGPKAAKEVLKGAAQKDQGPISKLSSATRKAISQNIGGKTAKTSKEYVDNTQGFLNDKFANLQTNPVQSSLSANTKSTESAPGLSPNSGSAKVSSVSSSAPYSSPEPIASVTAVKMQSLNVPDEPNQSSPLRKTSVAMTMSPLNDSVVSSKETPQPVSTALSSSSAKANLPQDLIQTKSGLLVAV